MSDIITKELVLIFDEAVCCQEDTLFYDDTTTLLDYVCSRLGLTAPGDL